MPPFMTGRSRPAAREGIPPLAAAFGPAEIDKAIVDALFRALGVDVFDGFKANAMGLDARLTPDLDDAVIAAYLGSRKPVTSVAVRHTVGSSIRSSRLATCMRRAAVVISS